MGLWSDRLDEYQFIWMVKSGLSNGGTLGVFDPIIITPWLGLTRKFKPFTITIPPCFVYIKKKSLDIVKVTVIIKLRRMGSEGEIVKKIWMEFLIDHEVHVLESHRRDLFSSFPVRYMMNLSLSVNQKKKSLSIFLYITLIKSIRSHCLMVRELTLSFKLVPNQWSPLCGDPATTDLIERW